MRFAIIGLFAIGALLCLQGRAQALTEFCPASVTWHAFDVPGQTVADQPAAQLYSFELDALGARSVRGVLGIETNDGWYLAPFPSAALTAHATAFTSDLGGFTQWQFYSAPMYVRFPASVRIERMWVAEGATQGDVAFGWDAKGRVLCDPPVGAAPGEGAKKRGGFVHWKSPPRNELLNLPVVTSVVLTPTVSTPPVGLTCAKPFVPARALHVAALQLPVDEGMVSGMASVDVAIDPDGKLVDAWVWAPSSNKDINEAALQAAKTSTYQAGTALCHPVPGVYAWTAIFNQLQ